jgi:transposase InsO family protein
MARITGVRSNRDVVHRARQSLGELRDELLNGELFYILREAQALTERWRRDYNTARPHSALGYRPPAPESVLLKEESTGQREAA